MQRTEWVKKLADYIEETLPCVLSLDELAAYIGLSKAHMQRQFKRATGLSIGHYIRNRRLSHAAIEIANTDKRIIDVAMDCDFESQEAFGRAFRQFFGLSPKNLKKHPEMANNLSRLPLSLKYLALYPELAKNIPTMKAMEQLQLHGLMQHFYTDTLGSEDKFQISLRNMWDKFLRISADWTQQPRRYFTVENRNACFGENGGFTMMAMCTGPSEAHDELVSFTLSPREMLSFQGIRTQDTTEFLTYLHYVYLPDNNLFVNRLPVLWEAFEDGHDDCYLSVTHWHESAPNKALKSLDETLFTLPTLQGEAQYQQIPFTKQQSVERLTFLIEHWQDQLALIRLDDANKGKVLLLGDDLQNAFTPDFEFHSRLLTINNQGNGLQVNKANYLRALFVGTLTEIAEAIEYVKYSVISEQPYYLVHGYEIMLKVTALENKHYEILLLLPAKKR